MVNERYEKVNKPEFQIPQDLVLPELAEDLKEPVISIVNYDYQNTQRSI